MSAWRRWNVAIHRDLGFLAAGLTLVYAISGVAVNHTADWNPSYRIERQALRIAPLAGVPAEALAGEAQRRLALGEPPRESFRPDPETLQLFYEQRTYTVKVATGEVTLETTRPRPVLFPLNQLHLNAPKGAWTWIADGYALVLALLALTGVLVPRGRKGLCGRGGLYVAAGVAVPVLFWFFGR